MNIFVNHAIEILNQAVKADSKAIDHLINCRVPCNGTLANHPTIQVGAIINKTRSCEKSELATPYDRFEVGLLGIINGLFGADDDDWGFIAAQYEDGKLIGFVKTPPRGGDVNHGKPTRTACPGTGCYCRY
ncbi:hypothetical protein M7775_13655 [Sporomusa sphaeroides DSM 2875]|uniref:hypothetical protein n=1 Tax=Sporomusa sphaeroides TaxID=47679 RepID=UPI00202FFE16|nr:hypothetical protein [Sporomusa sphaeroides]MCM0759599.1 hypothetical protein [Sporomusa sphaeroides DSM 2875]